MTKYHYDIIVRSKESTGNKESYLDDKHGEIILHKKSKNKGVSLEDIKNEIGVAEFQLLQRLYKDMDKVGWLEQLIKIEVEAYKMTKGISGWSPKMVERIRKICDNQKNVSELEE